MAKIMIVDDSETIRNQLKATLQGAGHQVVEGVDGVSGLEVIQANKDVKLILCDVNMPRMDGLTMCQKVHEIPDLQKIPILMLTTESSPEMKTKGKEAGVVAWVTKPYVDEKLVTAVQKLLSKA